jgi:hypothetical protein
MRRRGDAERKRGFERIASAWRNGTKGDYLRWRIVMHGTWVKLAASAPSRSRLVKTSERGGNVSIASIAKGAVET